MINQNHTVNNLELSVLDMKCRDISGLQSLVIWILSQTQKETSKQEVYFLKSSYMDTYKHMAEWLSNGFVIHRSSISDSVPTVQKLQANFSFHVVVRTYFGWFCHDKEQITRTLFVQFYLLIKADFDVWNLELWLVDRNVTNITYKASFVYDILLIYTWQTKFSMSNTLKTKANNFLNL